MLWVWSLYSLNISEGGQVTAFLFCSGLSLVALYIRLQTIFAVP